MTWAYGTIIRYQEGVYMVVCRTGELLHDGRDAEWFILPLAGDHQTADARSGHNNTYRAIEEPGWQVLGRPE